MPHDLNPLVCFNGGEWSPSMDSRIDLPNYRKACRQLRNMIPLKQGGATRRPGTQAIAGGKASISGNPSVSRLQKFQYSPDTSFILEFCDHGIRFYSNGAQVTLASAPVWVSGTSYPAGAFVDNGMGSIFYLYNGPIINSTIDPLSDWAHWSLQNIYEVPTPYLGTNFTAPDYWDADVFQLQCCQINDVVYIVHPDYPVYKLTRYSDTNWVMQQVQFLVPAMLDQNATDTSITASTFVIGPGVTLTATAPSWITASYYIPGNSVIQSSVIYNCTASHVSGTFTTDLANGLWTSVTIFQAGHVGSYWQLAYNRPTSFIEFDAAASGDNYTFSMGTWYGGSIDKINLIGNWTLQTYGTWTADVSLQASYDNGSTWKIITTVSSRNDANFNVTGTDSVGAIYTLVVTNPVAAASSTPPRVVLTAENQFVYGLVQITSVTNAYLSTCTVITPLYSTSATIYWSEGAWSDVRGYPHAVTVFQERAWYGCTTFQPQRIWATQTDDLENFSMLDQSQATYGMAFDLNAPGRGPIQWLAAQNDLFAGLAGAEWVITSGQGQGQNTPITPTSVLALENSANGSASNIPGIIANNAVFYVQRKRTQFQQMLFSVFTGKYMSQDMQVLSQHLTASLIHQFDFQQQFENQSLLWAVCGDGSLISLTYSMDQEVFGWAKHTTGEQESGNDLFLSVQVIYGKDGSDDEVWFSTLRDPGNSRRCTIERLWPIDWQTVDQGQPDLLQSCYADLAQVFISPATNVLHTGPSSRPLVASLNGNIVFTDLVPTNLPPYGQITLPNYVPKTGDVVVVGLPINWKVQPMRLDVTMKGPMPAITKAISKLYLRLLNSIGGNWATRQGEVTPLPTYKTNFIPGNPPPFYPNEPIDVEVDTGPLMQYEDDPQFIIQGSDPLPFTILGIVVKEDIGGSP